MSEDALTKVLERLRTVRTQLETIRGELEARVSGNVRSLPAPRQHMDSAASDEE